MNIDKSDIQIGVNYYLVDSSDSYWAYFIKLENGNYNGMDKDDVYKTWNIWTNNKDFVILNDDTIIEKEIPKELKLELL